ncbi:hypothetical protein ABVT39_023436 [Epinephelus coioides]
MLPPAEICLSPSLKTFASDNVVTKQLGLTERTNVCLQPAAAALTVARPNHFHTLSHIVIPEDCHMEVKIKLWLPEQRAVCLQLQLIAA